MQVGAAPRGSAEVTEQRLSAFRFLFYSLVIASEAKQIQTSRQGILDCFVASLLAMTKLLVPRRSRCIRPSTAGPHLTKIGIAA
jgi:hypothetical protein